MTLISAQVLILYLHHGPCPQSRSPLPRHFPLISRPEKRNFRPYSKFLSYLPTRPFVHLNQSFTCPLFLRLVSLPLRPIYRLFQPPQLRDSTSSMKMLRI